MSNPIELLKEALRITNDNDSRPWREIKEAISYLGAPSEPNPILDGQYRLKPLSGKYYGTKIEGPNDMEIKIWGNRIGVPSEREVEDKFPYQPPDQEELSNLMCDGHYEDVGDYEIAKVIVNALNSTSYLIAQGARRDESLVT